MRKMSWCNFIFFYNTAFALLAHIVNSVSSSSLEYSLGIAGSGPPGGPVWGPGGTDLPVCFRQIFSGLC